MLGSEEVARPRTYAGIDVCHNVIYEQSSQLVCVCQCAVDKWHVDVLTFPGERTRAALNHKNILEAFSDYFVVIVSSCVRLSVVVDNEPA